MPKKMIKLLLLIVAVFTVAGCNNETTMITTDATTVSTTTPTTITTTITTPTTSSNLVTLPDLTGMDRDAITTTLEGLGLEIKYYFDVSTIYDEESDYDKFVQYGSDLDAGDTVEAGSEVKVYTTPLNLELKYIYELDTYEDEFGNPLLLQESDYTGSEFIEDGIGEVTVEKFVDGDTTWFKSGGTSFSVRYLGIDTPESTSLYEPWGKAAARYTLDKLQDAETIVLQAEGVRTDGNGRYLAWVWYRTDAESDFMLLNLELVELAYSRNKVSTGSKYTTILTLADWDASLTKRRVWGEIDPEYDYSKEGTQMSIEYLLNNFDDYVGLKVVITGTITRVTGDEYYFQDEFGYGIYMFTYLSSAQLQVGANLTLGGLVPMYYSGCPQLSNFSKQMLTVNDPVTMPEPLAITYDDFTFTRIGSLVEMENLIVTGMNQAQTSIYVRDANSNTFTVRIDDSALFTASDLGITAGDVISVVGPLGYYDYDYDGTNPNYIHLKANYQLILTSMEDITIQ